jgi:hypothetical protein
MRDKGWDLEPIPSKLWTSLTFGLRALPSQIFRLLLNLVVVIIQGKRKGRETAVVKQPRQVFVLVGGSKVLEYSSEAASSHVVLTSVGH